MQFVPSDGASRLREFNHNHDQRGRFASGPGGAGADLSPIERAKAIIQRDKNFDIGRVVKIMGPEFEQDLKAKMGAAPEANAQLQAGLQGILSRVGGEEVGNYHTILSGEGIRGVMGPIKTARRVVEKAILDYKGDIKPVNDVVRATIATDKVSDIHRVREALGAEFEVVPGSEKDRFASPTEAGYRDYMLKVRTRAGIQGEFQINVRPMLVAKEEVHAKFYQPFRRLLGAGRTVAAAKLAAKMTAIYSAAWSVALMASRARGAV